MKEQNRFGFRICTFLVLLVAIASTVQAQSLYFKEYTEGSGNNKAFEVYNPLFVPETSGSKSEKTLDKKNYSKNLELLTSHKDSVGESVQVIFLVNTATMPDTLQEEHYLAVFGAIKNKPDPSYLGQTITWDNTTDLIAENINGDYWKVSFNMLPGDTLDYKFWAGVNSTSPLLNGSELGWETGESRRFFLPNDQVADTTMPLTWFEARDEAPFIAHPDSISIYFRVNIGYHVQKGDFDPAKDKVGLRGDPNVFSNPADWSSSAIYLESEGENSPDNWMYNGFIRLAKSDIESLESPVNYQFVLETDEGVTWDNLADGSGNRKLSIPDDDETIHWVYFTDIAPIASLIETELNFEVNTSTLESIGYFDPEIDTMYVKGEFNGWGSSDVMYYDDASETYKSEGIKTFVEVGDSIGYKYFIRWADKRDDDTSEFYLPEIVASESGWEELGINGGGNRKIFIENNVKQPSKTEFFNGVAPEGVIAEGNVIDGEINVVFSIDMNPAKENEIRPFIPGSDSVFLLIESRFFGLTNGLKDLLFIDFLSLSQSEMEKTLFTDEDEDGIYELDLELNLPTLNHIGFIIGYGTPGIDNSFFKNGGGFGAGRRYYQYINPIIDLDLNVSWPNEFYFPTLTWKAEDLPWEAPPDYSKVTDSSKSVVEIRINDRFIPKDSVSIIPVKLEDVSGSAINSYSFTVEYDSTKINLSAIDTSGTLSSTGTLIGDFSSNSSAQISWSSANPITNSGTLLNLVVESLGEGESTVSFKSVLLNNGDIEVEGNSGIITSLEYICGDVTNDFSISSLDASHVLRHTVFLTPEYPLSGRDSVAADVTGNGRVSALDASRILQFESGLIEHLSCGDLVEKEYRQVAEAQWFFEETNDQEMSVNIDLSSSEFDIYSAEFEFEFSEGLTFNGFSNMPKNWIQSSNRIDNKILVSLIGIEALANKKIEFSIRKNADISSLYTTAKVSINEAKKITLNKLSRNTKPEQFQLFQNYPNPFNPSTTISYSIPISGKVELTVFNMLGRKVVDLVNENKEAGLYSAKWDASQLSSGVYIYQLSTESFSTTKKMMLIK